MLTDIYSRLDEAGHSERTFPEFWLDLEEEYGSSLYSDFLFQLTRLEFEEAEARTLWVALLDHWRELSSTLGREVALTTAVCDFFSCTRPMLEIPVVVDQNVLDKNERFAFVDDLTGLYNRRYFRHELDREMARSRRTGRPFSLLMIDIDHFKNFNDTWGHLAGDAALRHVSQLLRRGARVEDRVVRYGGEEFAVILPGADQDEALRVAERHRQSVAEEKLEIRSRDYGNLTVSIGLSTYPGDADTDAGLIQRADECLYLAKRSGRNCVCTQQTELRRHPRFPLRLPAKCRIVRVPGSDEVGQVAKSDEVQGSTVNLSLSGMLFEGPRPISPGRLVEAVLNDNGEQRTVELRAQSVRMVESNGKAAPKWQVGLAFADHRIAGESLQPLIADLSEF